VVSFNTVAASILLIVDLSGGIALRADMVDIVEGRKASTRSDNRIPDLVEKTLLSADSINGVVDEVRRANSATVSNQVVSGLADAFAINPIFISIASSNAESKTFNPSFVTDTLFGDIVVG